MTVDTYESADPLRARIAIHAYGTNPQPWYEFVRERIPRTGRLLDVGAGTGALWGEPYGGDLVLADRSAAMCAILRDRAPVVNADAQRLPFPDATFGTVVACHMLYHVPDPRQALREMARVLKNGGAVAVATNGHAHMGEVADLVEGFPRVHDAFPAERVHDEVAAFFDDVVTHPYDDTLRVTDPDVVSAYLGTDVSERVRERMVDGVFTVTKDTVLVTGVRRAPS